MHGNTFRATFRTLDQNADLFFTLFLGAGLEAALGVPGRTGSASTSCGASATGMLGFMMGKKAS